MEKRDARTLNQEAQEEQRRTIVALRQKGISNNEVAEIVGTSASHTSIVWNKYQKGGKGAIAKKQRGRRVGECKVLSAEQECDIKRTLLDKTPDQLKFKFALWTRQALQELIRHKYGQEVPQRTITDYLKRWGFSCQKPAKRAYEQHPVIVQKWLDEEYPAIVARARKEKAEIYWGDETGIENTEYQARGFAPIGQTPLIQLNAKKSRINVISAISNNGTLRFIFYQESMNADCLITFMKRLIRDADKKVYLILDNLRVHHSILVKAWLEENKEKIEVFYLPSYSPELNPDEYLNDDLKRL